MAENMNTCSYCGTVAEDIEVRTSQNGKAWCNLFLDIEAFRGKDNPPEVVRLKIFAGGHMANSLAAHVKVGMVLLAHCDLQAKNSPPSGEKGTVYPRLDLMLNSYGLLPKKQAESKPSTKWRGKDIPPPDDDLSPPF